jgi:pSer/pThr/pTyr-binding forkhead associated (FHA) protein
MVPRDVNADDRARGNPPDTLRPEKGGDSGFQSRAKAKYALRFHGRDLPLIPSELVIGRSEACGLVLDGPLISRRHARLVVTDASVVVEDLASRNGVFVNSIQIRRPVLLKGGDVIMIGDESLELVECRTADFQSGRVTAADPRLLDPALKAPPLPRIDLADESPTRGSDAFDLLRSVVDKAFAVGRPDEAERVLRMHLDAILDQAREGRGAPPEQCKQAAAYATRLANATGRPEYLNYPVRLYHHLGEPLPLPIIDELYGLIRRVRGVDRALLRKYVALLRSRAAHMAPAERFALQRVEGLERLASL